MAETSLTNIPERVARGVALLDAKKPGWDQRIDLDKLDIGDCFECVIGQLYGDRRDPYCTPFDFGAGALLKVDVSDPELTDLGFSLPDGTDHSDAGWGSLTAEWKRAIAERRESAEIPSGGES